MATKPRSAVMDGNPLLIASSSGSTGHRNAKNRSNQAGSVKSSSPAAVLSARDRSAFALYQG
jgi:hypothetical protein